MIFKYRVLSDVQYVIFSRLKSVAPRGLFDACFDAADALCQRRPLSLAQCAELGSSLAGLSASLASDAVSARFLFSYSSLAVCRQPLRTMHRATCN